MMNIQEKNERNEGRRVTANDKLRTYYNAADKLNEEFPKELMDKLSIYGRILEIIGGLHADALREWKLAESERKGTIAETYMIVLNEGDKPATSKYREMVAEQTAIDLRRKEAIAESEAMRWRNAYNSVLEQIQIMKKRYEHLTNVSKGGI